LIPQKINEWDFIRYGTISHGERIIGADPPVGFLDPRVYKGLDRFTVTFDSPNYVYVDEISVETTSGPTPAVVATRRRENDGPETVEILLDRPISIGATTRFMFNDGVATNLVEYTLSDPVPTLSQTGLAVLGVGLLIAAVIVLGRSHRPVQVQ
jgi:hypothetical protein